jgi:hypothetical protein
VEVSPIKEEAVYLNKKISTVTKNIYRNNNKQGVENKTADVNQG